jgi:hypothetical protein
LSTRKRFLRSTRKIEPTPQESAEVESAAVKFLAELDAMFDAFVSAA